jgi:glycosyltransferase involved in cell wall biosynthesis
MGRSVMEIRIVTRTDWPSFNNVAIGICKAIRSTCTCKVQDWRTADPGGNILFIDTVHAESLNFLDKIMSRSNVVFYGTTEGVSLLDGKSLAVAKRATIVAVSKFVKQMLEEIGVPVAGVLHHAIDMKDRKVDSNSYKEWKTRTKRQAAILTVSANHPRKGLNLLLEAYGIVEQKVRDSFLIIHSQDCGYWDLNMEARRLGIRRFYLTNLFGEMKQQELNALYKICKVYVQPSFTEGFGLPILEAFRFGKPVIAVNAPPFNEIIKHRENGILIPPADVRWYNFENKVNFKMHSYKAEDLADAIVECMLDQDLYTKMRTEIFKERNNWDAQRLYPRLLDYFRR